ncbi:hypothetical protein A3D88_01250 [Candidatus Peribacteria bacterium RIFCSPHIGHO2_02_FULL_52_16]|nr:MAG: hypothetical protein A2706_05975 [Candidatus Peribacteria bacterium RIFCSPHIGHO2_01_FULL_51_35]OGJ61290.1 MAG: hypothetical protein A3D88_01250 [Candidatus Peribacteria bacterium RIFCSPHIGHO2_02_FULL_52_16]
MKRFWMILAGALLLSACGTQGTAVYNHLGNVVGSVRVDDDNHATIFNDGNESIGTLNGKIVHAQKRRAGQVTDNKILDIRRKEIGTVVDGTDCYNASGMRVGRLSSVINPEAAGGACLLLLLQ